MICTKVNRICDNNNNNNNNNWIYNNNNNDKSKLNGRNKIKAVNTWAVSLLRYGGGVIGWTKEKLQSMNRKTRKVMTMNKELHPRSDTARIYVPRKRGGRGRISCEACVRGEENSLGWYVGRCNEVLLRKVGERGTVKTDEVKEPTEYKKSAKQKTENKWKGNQMHGQYVRDLRGVDWDKTWRWMQKGDLTGCAEALICSAQEQALRTNYIKFHIDKNVESPMCRMRGEKGKSVNHLTSECSKLAQREYKRRHDNVARYVHWQLCGKADFEQTDKWYKHTPERVLGNEGFKVLWDFNIQCDRIVETRRPDIVFVNKQAKEVMIIDVAISGDARVKDKELEKIEKNQLLREEIRKLWKLKKVTVEPVVIGREH